MATRDTFDPIAVVETAYQLEGGLDEWLDRLARAVHPVLDAGFGTQAVLYRMDDRASGSAEVVGVGLAGTVPGMRAFLEGIVEDLDSRLVRILFERSTRLWTWREVAPSPWREQLAEVRLAPNAVARDWKAVAATEEGRWALLVGGHAPEPQRTDPWQRRLWQRVATHLGAATRLRCSLMEGELLTREAVLSPTGKLVHAEGEARSRTAREHLELAARQMDQARGRLRHAHPMRAVELWRGLVSGRWSLVDQLESDGRHLIVAMRNDSPHPDPRALTQRQRQVTQLVRMGHSNKEIGYALGLSESAVATHLSVALRKMGLSRRHDLVAMLRSAEVVTSARQDGAEIAIAKREMEPVLPPSLSRAERAVALGALRGLSDREIAFARAVSPRTVANQLRSAFRKAGVHSRSELATKCLSGYDAP